MASKPMTFGLVEEDYPTKDNRQKFEVGCVYRATTYHGNYDYYLVVKRSPSGYITFQEIYPNTGNLSREKFARKPLKGWENADERVTIKSGTYGRVCSTGGCTLYARNKVRRL